MTHGDLGDLRQHLHRLAQQLDSIQSAMATKSDQQAMAVRLEKVADDVVNQKVTSATMRGEFLQMLAREHGETGKIDDKTKVLWGLLVAALMALVAKFMKLI